MEDRRSSEGRGSENATKTIHDDGRTSRVYIMWGNRMVEMASSGRCSEQRSVPVH